MQINHFRDTLYYAANRAVTLSTENLKTFLHIKSRPKFFCVKRAEADQSYVIKNLGKFWARTKHGYSQAPFHCTADNTELKLV